jgi:hypothetical protein
MKKLIIKEIDKFQSKLFKDKVLTEYLVYYMENDVKVITFTTICDGIPSIDLDEILDIAYSEDNDLIIEIIQFEEDNEEVNTYEHHE